MKNRKTSKPRRSKPSHVWTPAELALLGFEFLEDIRDPVTGKRGKLCHVEGDEVGDAILARIDAGTLTVDAARAAAAARRQRGARLGSQHVIFSNPELQR